MEIIKAVNGFYQYIEEINFFVVVKSSNNRYDGKNLFFLNSKSEIIDTIENYIHLVV